jgi:two-component system, NtrC family, nitrogen regulation sensor histidine kinase NtrY
MPVPYQRRIFLVMVALGAIPVALAVVGWALAFRTAGPTRGAVASLESVAGSARTLTEVLDTTRLGPQARAALRAHLDSVSLSLTLARRADTMARRTAGAFAALVLLLGAALVYASVRLAGHLSRQLSRPIDELVQWTELIRTNQPLPATSQSRGAREFEVLQQALMDLARALETARTRELEAERLRAVREVARRVAHEIKNPLTSMRIALDQMRRADGQTDGRTGTALEVLEQEQNRLERLAKEFAEFGRLPEGPRSDVDVRELLETLSHTAVPAGVMVTFEANGKGGGDATILGYYEPLQRAFSNLLRNAAEAMGGAGWLEIEVGPDPTARAVRVRIADHGPGVPAEFHAKIFEPYFTTKSDGTGLGLALVRQAIEAHQGTIALSDTPGGGATFTVTLPR